MHSKYFLLPLLLNAAILSAQQRVDKSAATPQVAAAAPTLPKDPSKMADLIRGSYYHPDDLTTIDCSISVDWVKFLGSMKQTVPDERLKLLNGLKVHSHAVRGKAPELTFDWAGGEITTKEQMEGGMKQIIGGFYQTYWSLFGSSLVKTGEEVKKIDLMPDGSASVNLSSGDTGLVATVSQDGSPTHMVLDSPAMKGTIDPQYVASPHPIPGDLRRLSSIKLIEQIGESHFNVDMTLDYQDAGGFSVPKNVLFDVIGAYAIPIEFSACTTAHAESTH
jgi:hypothetical protein